MIKVVLSLFLLVSVSYATSPFQLLCGSTFNNSYVSLFNLSTSSGYFFNNVSLTPIEPSGSPNMTVSFELQVCGAVSSRNSNCSNSNSAVNFINSAGECYSAGEANVAAWMQIPSLNGVSLVYYHGANISHTQEYSTRIYFECNPDMTNDTLAMANMTYEHYDVDIAQFHFTVQTATVCSIYSVPAPQVPDVINNCTTSFRGSLLNFTSLISANGSYSYVNSTGIVDAQHGYPNNPATTSEIQICRNISQSLYNCASGPAHVVSTASNGTRICISTGDVAAYAWSLNPDTNGGVSLIYYHGDLVGNSSIATYSSRIYLECPGIVGLPSGSALNTLYYEHFNVDASQYHYVMYTYSACPANFLTTGSVTTTHHTSSASLIFASIGLIVAALVL